MSYVGVLLKVCGIIPSNWDNPTQKEHSAS
jgi:hypothetical protein